MKIPTVQIELKKIGEIDLPTENIFAGNFKTAGAIFIQEIGRANVEKVAVICMDSTSKIINFSVVSIGGIDKVNISISQIIKTALLSNASKIMIGHNHPSGVLEITSYDIDVTRKIAQVAKFLGIELVDSVVVNEENAVSIREERAKSAG